MTNDKFYQKFVVQMLPWSWTSFHPIVINVDGEDFVQPNEVAFIDMFLERIDKEREEELLLRDGVQLTLNF